MSEERDILSQVEALTQEEAKIVIMSVRMRLDISDVTWQAAIDLATSYHDTAC